jgi:hypothetical protein
VPAEVEGELLGERFDRGEAVRLERRAPDEQEDAVPGPDQGEVPGGLRRAVEPFQRRHRGQRQLQALPRREAERMRQREEPARRETPEIGRERLDGGEVLGERAAAAAHARLEADQVVITRAPVRREPGAPRPRAAGPLAG